MATTTPLCGEDLSWADRVIARCETRYVGDQGLLVTELDGEGQVTNPEPLLADFGDVLPFLERFGRPDFVAEQLKAAKPHLKTGLYAPGGRIRLFSNHDWLLGLLELYRSTGDQDLLKQADAGARTIIERMFVRGLLVDELPVLASPRTWLGRASPFNGGYIELWLELYELTGERIFLEASERLAAAWAQTPGFREHGVFFRIFSARAPWLDRLAASAATLHVQLFKDNTNFVWSLLALAQATGSGRWAGMVSRWVEGFEALFLNGGEVWLWLDRSLKGREVSLKAAFSAIDLLCDISLAKLSDRALPLAEIIAQRWLGLQWENGLFPETPGGRGDHLDGVVDMAMALMKLAGITKNGTYAEAAARAARGVVAHHETPNGLALRVDRGGVVVSGRIIVKYQSLALKLALAPADPAQFIGDDDLLVLLRDR